MFLLLVLSFHWAVAELPGICYVQKMVTLQRNVIDRQKIAWKHEDVEVPQEEQQCCEGYRQDSAAPHLKCVPVCEPPCVNAVCEEPDTCVCHPGHRLINNSSSSCYDVCESCVNGRCVGDVEECVCDEGYERDPDNPHICNARCVPPCLHGICVAPGQCRCPEGFMFRPSWTGCVPNCMEACVYGRCTSSNTCTCFEGYINDETSPSVCIPVCSRLCENGDCGGPDICVCREGYRLHQADPFRCVPSVPENYNLNRCAFRLENAITFDRENRCFVIKEEVAIVDNRDCRPLTLLSRSACDNSFRCSTVESTDGSIEIHCNLEKDSFETESVQEIAINGSEWVDIELVLTFHELSNSSRKDPQPREWFFRPSSKRTVCGTMDFGARICEGDSSRLNVLTLTKISIVLIIAFLLMFGAGIGGFLWLRHRKLNDPLNYREDGMRGCYQNQCFLDQVEDLAPDDESLRDFPFT